VNTCLPVNDPYAVVVNSRSGLMQAHIDNPELEVAFLPEYDDVPADMQAVMNQLAELNVQFKFKIDYWGAEYANGNVFNFQENDKYVDEHKWCSNIRHFLTAQLNISKVLAMRFARWLLVEMQRYLKLFGNKSSFAVFTTNSKNLEMHSHGQYWHNDVNSYAGIKNYVGGGTLYAPKKTSRENKDYDNALPLSTKNCIYKIDGRYSLYQLKNQGVNLHKGGVRDDGEVSAVHKLPVNDKSSDARIILLFGLRV
jgi:hypothetical protein